MPGAMTQASQQTTANEHVQRQLRAASVEIVEFVGIKILKVLYMENTNMFTFKHPKYYKELRARNKSDQAISSCSGSTESAQRSPGPGPKLQATSTKPQASSAKLREK